MTITMNNIISLGVAAILLLVLPIIYVVVWKRRKKESVSWKPLLIGAVGFLVTVRVLELLVHVVCLMTDNPISRFINGNTVAYVMYGIAMAGIFEECGRYVIIKFMMKKNKTADNMVMYGIGHGGMEVWAVSLMTVVSYLAVGALVVSLGYEAALENLGVTPELESMALPTLNIVSGFHIGTALLYVVERIFCMFAHIAFTLIVYKAIYSDKKHYLWIAVLLHAVFDLLPSLYQRGMVSLVITEVWIAVCSGLLMCWAVKLKKDMQKLTHDDKF